MKHRLIGSLLLAAVLAVGLACPLAAERSGPLDPPVADYLVSNGTVRMQVGEKQNVTPLLTYYKSEEETYPIGNRIWTSANPEVASVNSDGIVTAHKTGTAKITIQYADNRALNVEQTVRIKVVSGKTAPQPQYLISINEGWEIDMVPLFFPGIAEDKKDNIQWAIQKNYAASLTGEGRVYGKSYGTSKVSATYTDEEGNTFTREATIKVIARHHINLREISLTLSPGDRIDMVAVLHPHYAGPSSYLTSRTDDPAVVELGENHQIIAKGTGETIVRLNYSFGDEEQRHVIRVRVE